MKKRYIGYAVWLISACLLYFFENNTGTRIVLACTLLLPLVPVIRRGLSEQDADGRPPRIILRTAGNPAEGEADDFSGVRVYLPGDPVNRIHWKLSAKKDELLIREQSKNQEAEEAETKAVPEAGQPSADRRRRRGLWTGLFLFLFSMILLFASPSAGRGMKALLNRLFEASEAVNAYAYTRFAVSADEPVAFTAVLLLIMGVSLAGMILLSGSRLPAMGLMAGIVLFQVFFGLSFPAWINVTLFTLLFLRMLKRPLNRKTVLFALGVILLVSLAVPLLFPGVDAATEAASETARDQLSRMAQSVTGMTQELPAGETETRHMHTQSLTAGDYEARPEREYRLITQEEEQIARPHWVNYLRIILLLLLTAAVVILPFLPFILLNRRRKKAMEARKAFQSGNVREAVTAIFQHLTAWLEATGYGGGNQPYAAWNVRLSPDIAERYAACEKIFEEAAYSSHEMKEEQRQQALALLHETEQILRQRADWKQRLRLRYRECLWI